MMVHQDHTTIRPQDRHSQCAQSLIECRFYALSAATATFRERTYSHDLHYYCIQSGDGDYLMNETRRTSTTGTRCPTLSDKWHWIFYMPSRINTTGHTNLRPLIFMNHRPDTPARWKTRDEA